MIGTHFIERCPHGTVVSQCRCIGPKTERIVPCPFPEHAQEANGPAGVPTINELLTRVESLEKRVNDLTGHTHSVVSHSATGHSHGLTTKEEKARRW